jgi:hypothetical protein
MRALSKSRSDQWIADRGIALKASGHPAYAHGDFRCIEIRVPLEGRHIIAMGYTLLVLEFPTKTR